MDKLFSPWTPQYSCFPDRARAMTVCGCSHSACPQPILALIWPTLELAENFLHLLQQNAYKFWTQNLICLTISIWRTRKDPFSWRKGLSLNIAYLTVLEMAFPHMRNSFLCTFCPSPYRVHITMFKILLTIFIPTFWGRTSVFTNAEWQLAITLPVQAFKKRTVHDTLLLFSLAFSTWRYQHIAKDIWLPLVKTVVCGLQFVCDSRFWKETIQHLKHVSLFSCMAMEACLVIQCPKRTRRWICNWNMWWVYSIYTIPLKVLFSFSKLASMFVSCVKPGVCLTN